MFACLSTGRCWLTESLAVPSAHVTEDKNNTDAMFKCGCENSGTNLHAAHRLIRLGHPVQKLAVLRCTSRGQYYSCVLFFPPFTVACLFFWFLLVRLCVEGETSCLRFVCMCVRACMRACACVCVCACVCAVFSSFFPSFQFLCKEGTVAELKPITIGQGLFLGEWYALRHGRGWMLNLKNSQMFDLTSCFAQSGRRWTIPSEWCHQMNLL